MKILFGMHLDGAAWSQETASIGEIRTGPMGLLGILETKLGLLKPSVHPVQRIDEYMTRIQSIDEDSRWFHKSYAVDPWSTARQLLSWRDELVEAGWSGESLPKGSSRLAALAELENVPLPLSCGHSDRIRAVKESLKKNSSLNINSITLLGPLEMLPPVWRDIMDLLKLNGTGFSVHMDSTRGETDSNLVKVQSLSQQTVPSDFSKSDDSLILLEADNEWEAAEHLALWLASDQAANNRITILCGMDTSLLDQALKRHGLPSLGRQDVSQWREIQQILPLMLANAWCPVDVHLLAELLSLKLSPVPKRASQSLLKAMAQEPGVGGKAWDDALAEIMKVRVSFSQEPESLAIAKAQIVIEKIQALLVENRFDPIAGISEESLRLRCQSVIDWAGQNLEIEPRLAQVINQARQMQALSAGKGSIHRITLDRMLDTVMGAGNTSDFFVEEAAPWLVVDHPGQLVDPCGDVIWWGFNDVETGQPTHWSEQEQKVLESAGVRLEPSENYRRREAAAWQRALICPEKRFMAVYIAQIDGSESYHHPFWDTVLARAAQAGNSSSEEWIRSCIIRKCREFNHRQDWDFAQRHTTLKPVPPIAELPIKGSYDVPAVSIDRPRSLSYSQMSTLLGCPMKWTLQYHAGLRLPESQTIPTGNQMIGTFCHRIVEELYTKNSQPGVDEATKKAEALFDRLLPSMASELLLDGNVIELKRYRLDIVRAVKELVKSINQLGLKVEKTEAELEGTLDGIPFKGYADLLLSDGNGDSFVLDLKWSSRSKYRRQEVKDGSSLQLAAYAWMLRSADPSKQVHTGYFMLAQGEFISDSPMLGEEALTPDCTLEKVWDRGLASLNESLKQLGSGIIEVHGIKERQAAKEKSITDKEVSELAQKQYKAQGLLYQSPPCSFCDFCRLCGISGGVM